MHNPPKNAIIILQYLVDTVKLQAIFVKGDCSINLSDWDAHGQKIQLQWLS